MFIIGLTGGIATGKSTIGAMLRDLNVPVIDADIIAREVLEPNKPAWKKIRKMFGTEVFLESGEIDRVKLGKLVFSNPEARHDINNITHPYIHKEMKKQVFKYFFKGEQFVVLECPLLFETQRGLDYMHKTIVVTCGDDMQLDRLMRRNTLTQKDAICRIEAQMPLEQKCEFADFIIENSGTVTETKKQLEGIVKLIRSYKRHIHNRIILSVIVLIILYLLYLLLHKIMGKFG